MYVRIVQPMPARLGGFDVSGLRMHCAYDVTEALGELLVMHGFAIIERRLSPDMADRRNPTRKLPRA
jgi:hypothetical protein